MTTTDTGRRGRWRDRMAAVRSSLVWEALVAQRWWAWFGVLMFAGNLIIQLPILFLTVEMVDAGIVAQTTPLAPYLWRILGLAAFALIGNFAAAVLIARVGFQVEFDLRNWLYRSIHRADLRRLNSVVAGQLVTRSLTDLKMIEQFLIFIPAVLTAIPLLLALSIALVVVNPLMGIISVLAMPINLWVLYKFRWQLRALSWAELNERAEVTAAIDEPVRGIRVVKAFGREEYERSRVAAVTLKVYKLAMTRWRLLARYDLVIKSAPVVIQAGALLVGARLAAGGNLSLGVFLLAFQLVSLMAGLAQLFDQLASLWQYLNNAQKRLKEAMDLGGDTAGGETLGPVADGLEYRDVTFGYGDTPAVQNLDLSVAPGEIVVLTGGPGSGKTTVATLATGLLLAESGDVLLDGKKIRDLDLGEVTEAVRLVPEEPFLFAGTIRSNLQLADPAATDATMRSALWAAGADDIVTDLGGLDAEVGERGLTLSGGQRQRLALARALVRPSRVLVLDDALAAVNPSLEIQILDRVRQQAPDTAVLCVSRRKGAVALADRVHRLADAERHTGPQPVNGEAALPFDIPFEIDPKVFEVLSKLELSDEDTGVAEREVELETVPTARHLIRPFKWTILVAFAALVVQTLAQLSPELLFGTIADLVQDGNTAATDIRALALVGVAAFGALGAYWFRIYSQRFTQGVIYMYRRLILRRLTRLGIDYYDRELPGHVSARVVNDLDVILNFLQGSVFNMLTRLAQSVIGILLITVIAPPAAPIILVFLAVMVVVTAIHLPINAKALEWGRTELGRVVAIFEEDYTGRREIRSYGAVDYRAERFRDACWELRRARRWAKIVEGAYGSFLQFVAAALPAIVLYRTGDLVLAGSLSVGAALAVRLLSSTATVPLTVIARAYIEFLDVRVSWKRLREPFDPPILPVERPDPVPCPTLSGAVTFDRVRFIYPNTDRPVLEDLTFEIPARTVTALVGYTGAGKTSITKLLQRMYDPDSGAIRLDGADVRDLGLHSFRQRLGVVPQDAFVFRGDVYSNVRYGRLDATDEEIEDAARAVGGYEVLAGLPRGFDNKVDEEGRNLTAGQRQVIALARAWVARPDILLLDEATSSLDGPLENAVLEAVRRLDCTTITVTHRESVVAASDHVIVVDAGRVVDIGPRDDVVGRGGAYDRLWAADPDVAAGIGAQDPETAGDGAPGPVDTRPRRDDDRPLVAAPPSGQEP